MAFDASGLMPDPCINPGEDPEDVFYVHAQCHPFSPTWVRVDENDTLEATCGLCGQVVIRMDIVPESNPLRRKT